MKTTSLVVLTVLAVCAGSFAADSDRTDLSPAGVSPQGFIERTSSPLVHVSPRGAYTMEIIPSRTDFQTIEATLSIASKDGSSFRISKVLGHGFFVSDLGRIVAIETCDSNRVPARLTVLDLSGQALFRCSVPLLTDPALSADGTRLAYRSSQGVTVLDLASFEETSYPNYDLFAAGQNGVLVGVSHGDDNAYGDGNRVDIHIGRETKNRLRLGSRPWKVGFSWDGSSILLLSSMALKRVDLAAGIPETIYPSSGGAELRDILVTPDAIYLGQRKITGNLVSGELVTLNPSGRFVSKVSPKMTLKMRQNPSWSPEISDVIPWPIKPNAQHPVGNTYAEYQNYGGSAYAHPGVDVMGDPWQPVYAVRSGVVKAVLTTSGQWHWRVAVGDENTSGTTEGYLYAHLDEFSIAVNVGDTITKGQYLGDLVEWPSFNFTHCHFARIEDNGSKWYGDWLNTENPHIRFVKQTETDPPVFDPAKGGDLFAFCKNQTSTYLSPSNLKGDVDIIARVGDKIASNWICTVQEIRYTIYPLGNPSAPVVDDKLAVFYNMVLDTYQGGPIDPFIVELLYKDDWTCNTKGDYNDREYYHIITNSDGNQVYENSDLWEAWDTTKVSNDDYVIEVTAIDAAGNAATDSMVVTVKN